MHVFALKADHCSAGRIDALNRQIVVDSLMANLTGRGDRIIFVGIEKVNAVSLCYVVYPEGCTGKKLIFAVKSRKTVTKL